MIVLGLTGGFHMGSCDAAAALMRDGQLVAAVEEERLNRIKYSRSIPPARCIRSCLEQAKLTINDVDCVTLYVETYPEAAREMEQHLHLLFGRSPEIRLVNHHHAHAASAYYPSGFDEAAVLTFDWGGDGTSTSLWHGKHGHLELIERIERPNSLGIFYAAFTMFLGFDRGDEYKVMGLSSYGEPTYPLDEWLDVSVETYAVNPEILNRENRSLHQTVVGDRLARWRPELRRHRWAPIDDIHKNLAASVQSQFERAVLNLASRARRLTGANKLCIAGGGALNCKANGKLVSEVVFDEVYAPPFPNDTGCSFGAAAAVSIDAGHRIAPIDTAAWGPHFDDEAIARDLELLKVNADRVDDIADHTAAAIANGKLVGWMQGRLEVGPRALGHRSILADPRDPTARDRLNRYIKFRETFRPFAPSVLTDQTPDLFDFEQRSPFMSFTADVKVPEELPAITHADGTARLQTVDEHYGPYADLLRAMRERTGYGCVLNTSFNVNGQPIVCTPREAIYTFYGTGLDRLVLGHWVLEKNTS